jgi:hypothetical protein
MRLVLLAAMLSAGQLANAQNNDIVANQLVNGSFDNDLAGWTLENIDFLGSSWSNEGSDAAGSFRGTQNEKGGVFTGLDIGSQCVTVEAGEPYQLNSSAKLRSDNEISGQALLYAVWPLSGCANTKDAKTFLPGSGLMQGYPLEFDGWLSGQTRFLVPEGYSSVRIALSVVAFQGALEEDRFGAYFDDISFGKVKPDLIAGIDFAGQTAFPGSELTFDVSISNKDDLVSTANNITAKVQSGKRLRLVSETCPGDMVNTNQSGDGWISWFNIPSLAPGESHNCTITAELEPGVGTKIFPRLEVDCPDCDLKPSDNEMFDELAIGPRADIEARISAEPFQSIERDLSVLVELENLGTKAWDEVVLVNRPTGAILQNTSCSGSTITVEDANFISFPLKVEPGSTRACVLRFEYPTAEQMLTFLLTADSQAGVDYDPTNNTDSVSLTTVSLRVNWPSLDAGDANPGDGVCFTPLGRDGVCTLRGAIEEANALAGFQVVVLPYTANGYSLYRAGGDKHISITDTVEIYGELQGSSTSEIIADWTENTDKSRIFVIDSPGGPVEFSNLDLVGQDFLLAGSGGIVLINNAAVSLRNVLLKDGGANFSGGALYSNDYLTLENVFVSSSRAPFGAGIAFEPAFPEAVLTLVKSRVYDNTQPPFSPQSQGGGVWADGGTVRIYQSAIDNNYSTRGGGLALLGGAMGMVENSTFSSNEADIAGGGLWASPADVALNFVTFAHNEADASSDTSGEGGGVYASASSAVTVSNSIFSNNQAQADGILPKGSTCFGTMVSDGYNTFTPSTSIDADCSVDVATGDNNIGQATLDVLAPTGPRQVPFHDLIAEGQDIDLADPDCIGLDGNVVNQDQRALSRPVDGNQSGTARCDKGAVESDGGLPGLIVSCPPEVSVEAGSSTATSCSVTSVNGAAGNVFFSCLGNPPSCDFVPEPLILAADATANVEVIIYGNSSNPVSIITVDAILSPARGQADIEVTTTGDLGGDTVMINANVNGSGSIVSSPAGLDCNASCSEEFPQTGDPIELTATAAAGWTFSAWTGDCAGAGTLLPDGSSVCTVTASDDRTVGAVFVEDNSITVSVSISGQGQVTSAPAGIDCPGTCSADFADQGSNIILTASPGLGWYFTGWSGACSGTQSCSLPRNSHQAVTAGFAFGPVPSDVIFKDSFE